MQKHLYTFWRPIAAIRNGDIDDNPSTERVATWQPIDLTPLHPEYPCAHCILSGAGAIAAILGTKDIPEVSLTSPTVPGVTHKFTNLEAFNNEDSGARMAAGFHWRFSTIVGRDMGWKIWRLHCARLPASIEDGRSVSHWSPTQPIMFLVRRPPSGGRRRVTGRA
jgi:hypothetical protein